MRRLRRFFVALTTAGLLAAFVPTVATAVETVRVTGVSFTDADHGFIVGGRVTAGGGFVSYTADGGKTWRHGTLPQWMVGVGARNASAASVIGSFGNVAYSTGDSGASWASSGPMVPGAGALNMSDIVNLPNGTLVAVGQHIGAPEGDLATIWQSGDGGATWTKRFDGPVQPAPNEDTDPPSTIANLTGVGFAPDGISGWAVGTEWKLVGGIDTGFVTFKQLLAYKTSDGGSTWTTQTVSGATQPATSLSVVDGTTAWIGCTNGAVFRTADGSTWGGPYYAPFGSTLGGRFSVDAVDGMTAFAVGQQGRVSSTTNGGLNWSAIVQPTGNHLYAVDMVTASIGYAGGDGGVLLRTADAGATWQLVPPLTTSALTITASPLRVPSGQPASISGILRTTAGAGVSGRVVSLQYSADTITWNVNGSTTTAADGSYTFVVSPTAKTYYRVLFAGEFGLDPSTSIAATVDMDLPPTTSVFGIPTGWSPGDVSISFTAVDDSGFAPTTRYTVDGIERAYTGTPEVVTKEGETALEYWSIDNLGQAETPRKTAVVRIDRNPPTVPGTPVALGVTPSSIALSWSASSDNPGSGVKGYRVYRDNVKVGEPTITNFSDTGRSANTAYSYTVSAVDVSGRESGRSAPLSVKTLPGSGGGGGGGGGGGDSTPPATTATGVPASWTNANATVTLTSSEPGTTFYILGGGVKTTYSAAFPVIAEGETALEFWSVDSAGNEEAPHQTAAIKIDKVPPTVTTDAKPVYEGSAVVNIAASDVRSGLKSIEHRLDAGAWVLGARATTSVLGAHSLQWRATDFAGNVAASAASFSVVPPAPAGKTATALAAGFTGTTATVFGTPYGGGTVTIEGVLSSVGTTTPVSGQHVVLLTSYEGSKFSTSTAAVSEVSPGRYRVSAKNTRPTWYRLRFAGTDAFGASVTPSLKAFPKASLTTPSAPSIASKAKAFVSSGYLKPRHSGSPVKIYCYRSEQVNGRPAWVLRATYTARAYAYTSTTTRYSASVRLPYAGTWKIRAYHSDAGHYPAYSAYRTLKVQ